jgi:hypothetical protein
LPFQYIEENFARDTVFLAQRCLTNWNTSFCFIQDKYIGEFDSTFCCTVVRLIDADAYTPMLVKHILLEMCLNHRYEMIDGQMSMERALFTRVFEEK